MMNDKSRQIAIHSVGNALSPWVNSGVQHYQQQCKKWVQLEHHQWQKIPNTPEEHWHKLSKKLDKNHLMISLDVKGKPLDSYEFSDLLRKSLDQSSLSFIIGGAFGLSPECIQASHRTWSLSNLTYSHTLIPIILAEQIYRGMSLIHRHPYHKS